MLQTKKEFYSLRKFKGVGLASALIGAALISTVIPTEYAKADEKSNVLELDAMIESAPTKRIEIVEKTNENNVNHTTDTTLNNTDDMNTSNRVSESSSENSEKDNVQIDGTKEVVLNTDKIVKTETRDLANDSSSESVNDSVNNSAVIYSSKSVVKPRNKRALVDESPYVSDKAKEVISELNDTLVMKKEDTASTSDTLFKLDEGLKVTEEEKSYVKAITDSFNDMPELVRSSVNSLTIERNPNGVYGYTYSKEGDIHMNMQYYHHELTHGEPGSLQQSVSVLGHEVGHIFNAKSFRDGDTWSFSRDPKYAELAKEVYGDSMTDNIHGRWASDFGSYVGWISGKSTPQTDGERKIYTYMDSLFKGILTPREDRITPELKSAVEAAKAGGKRLVYDGHVEFTADYKNVNDVKQKVQTLNSSEVGKIATSTHYKTYGYKTLVTTKYTSNGSDIRESTLTKNESSQLDIPGYNFVTKEVSHDGLLVEYKYAAKNTYSLDNDKLSADLDIQKGPSFIGDKNKANFRFTVKQPVNNLRLSYTIQNLTTGVYQTDSGKIGEAYVSSTNLKGASKQYHYTHNLGATESGYHASADLTYYLYTGAQGDNVYRMTVKILDGSTEIGSVSKDFVGKVTANKEHDLQGITLKSQTDLKDGKTIGAIVKNGNLYRPVIAAIGNINRDTKLANTEISTVRRDTMYPGSNGFDSVSKDAYVRYTILNSDYRLTDSRLETLSVLKDLKDSDTQAYLRNGLDVPLSKKDDLGYTVATYESRANGSGVLRDSVGSFTYVGNDKSARTDKVPIKIELLKVIDGKETVVDSTTVTKDVEIVNYDESLKPFFADDFQVRRRSNLGIATKSGDKYSVHKGRYGTGLEHARVWSYDRWNDGSSDSIERYRLSDVDSNKHVFLENLIGINIKQPTDAVFSDVDYTVHMDVFKRNDNKPLNFSEITLRSFVNRESILSTKDYKETVYWLDESGTRHLVGSNVSTTNEIFSNSYSIPTNAKSIEVDVTGKVPIQYAPSFLAQYITDDTFEKIRDENRFLNSKEGDTFDSRAYSVTSSLTDKLLNKKRDFKNQAIVRNKEILDGQTLLNIIGADKNNVKLNQPFRLSSNQVGLASSNGQLTSNNLLNTTELLADNSSKQFVLLEEGVQLSDTGWSKDSTFSFSGKTYTLYTKPWDKGKDINESDFSANAMISPLSSNLVANKTYDVFTGLIFKVKDGVSVIGHGESDTVGGQIDKIENKGLDNKILELLGKSSSGSKDNLNKLIGRKLVLNTKRSLEFTVNQTVEDSSVVTRDYAKSAGKQVDVAVTLSNGSQTTSPTLEVIQKLPVGDLNYTFVSPKENSNYTVFYTSDDDVSSDSNWSSSKPAKVTGLKWVRKSALNTGTIDKVAYTIQVSNDKSHVTKSVASATMKNGNLIGTVNDVAIRNDQEYRKLVIRKEVYDAIGNLIENVDVDVLSLPVGESVRYLDAVSGYFLNSVSDGSATQTGTDYTLPVVKANAWGDKTFTVPNRDTTMVFKFVKQSESLEARRRYTTTWDNGYVEPDVQKLAKLFNNVRTFEFLPNESSQAVKKFKLTYDSGIKGFGFVDINIDPKREDVVELHKDIRYQGDIEKDLGYKETTPGNNHTYTKVKSYIADNTGTFHESVTIENDVPAKDAVVTLGIKPTVKTETITKGKRYEADSDQAVKGQETIVTPGQDGVKTSTTRYTVNPITGDITSNTTVENTEKVDTVVKVGNKEVRTESIAITTRYVADPNMEAGQRHTDDDGEVGENQITTTYVVDSATGSLSNPQETILHKRAMRERVIRVGTKHVEVTETNVTTRYEADENSLRDTRTKIQDGTKGVHTKTTTYQMNPDGSLHSPVVVETDVPMTETVIRIGIKPTVETIDTPLKTRYVADENLEYGLRVEKVKGSDGRKVTTTSYELDKTNGTTRELIPIAVDTPMVEKVIQVGVKRSVTETPLDYQVKYIEDKTLDAGHKVQVKAGVPGLLRSIVTYTLDPDSGDVRVNPAQEERIESQDKVIKVGTRPDVSFEVLHKQIRYVEDPTKTKGETEVVTEGANGKVVTTTPYILNPDGSLKDGEAQVVRTEPKEKVVKVGTMPKVEIETLKKQIRYVEDSTKTKGETEVVTEGENGKVVITTPYVLNPDGSLKEGEPQVVRNEPKEKVVKVGTASKVDTQIIPIETRYVIDEKLDSTHVIVDNPGKEGKIVTTTPYLLNTDDGTITLGQPKVEQVHMIEKVVRVGTMPKVERQTLVKGIIYERDDTMEHGKREVIREGSDGVIVKTTYYEVNPKTGKLTEGVPLVERMNAVDKLIKVGTKAEYKVTEENYKTRYVRDDSISEGVREILVHGKKGTITTSVEYDMNSQTGDVSSRPGETLVVNPIDEVIKVGTKPMECVTVIPSPVEYIPDNSREVGTPNRIEQGEPGRTVIDIINDLDEVTGSITKRAGRVSAKTPTTTTVYVGTKSKITTTMIPMTTKYIDDSSLLMGEDVIEVVGRDGKITTVIDYTVDKSTGDVKASSPRMETVTMIERVIRRGTKAPDKPPVINIPEFTGGVVPNDAPVNDVPEFTGGVVPNDAPVNDVPEFTGGVVPNDAPVNDVPEFTGGVVPNDAPVNDVPEFTGGVVPNDAPVNDVPEFTGGVVPNDAPVNDVPEFTGGVVPNDAPVNDVPEFTGGVVPNDAPVNDVPEFTGGIVPNDAPVNAEKVLPYTGDASAVVSMMAGLGTLSLAGAIKRRKKD